MPLSINNTFGCFCWRFFLVLFETFFLSSQKLAAATEQISKLSGELTDRESHLRFYEEQLDLASKQAKEIEDRYDEMELKLGSVRMLLFYDF